MCRMYHNQVRPLGYWYDVSPNVFPAASIQGICRVRNKDIRKFLDGIYVSEKTVVVQD